MVRARPEPQRADSRHILDNPVLASLSGPWHAPLARGRGRVRRYLEDVSPFMGLPEDPTERDWADAAQLLGSGTSALVNGSVTVPDDWNVVERFGILQMTASEEVEGVRDHRAVRLTADDVPQMLDLTRRTAPGPFLRRTIDMGTYLGIRRDGALIGMAGERMRAEGWVEISAVCTAPEHRGEGLGTSLLRTMVAEIAAHGDRAFLHVASTNSQAVQLYKHLGFTARREFTVTVLRGPDLAVQDSA
ncbi:GNAT family N-acetyltransferase [Streptomyces sp. NPDC089424]|uniref:GNAT family N-acetyltransferase n=1 Tax=Streptomyces sp. NPDC089424 TaxID=3365917 RepID=UPI0037F24155